jgi:serine/threonine-protein kinase
MSTSQVCRTCGTALQAGDRFCTSCGTAVALCEDCGALLLPSERFCPKCGAAAPGSAPARTSAELVSPWVRVRERLASTTAGEFDLMRELGRGGMAAVYLAQELALNRRVAIKVMAPGIMMGEGMVDRFRQEAVTVANLTHPNIVTIHAVRQFEDLHFFVMQFVDGPSLDHVLGTTGPLPEPVVRAIIAMVGSGLAYAHRRGVIHRDIKPANILLDGDGNAIVMDFGIAKVAEVPGQTKTGTMVGTPAYMSPEQCAGEPLTWSSDLYSLGIVAYELLTGAPPFLGSNFVVMKGHLETPPVPIREKAPEVSEELEACILRMIAKLPDQRYASMAEALRAVGSAPLMDDGPVRLRLQELAGGSGATPTPPPAAPPPRPTPPSTARPHRSTRMVVRTNRIEVAPLPERIEPGDSFALTTEVHSPKNTIVADAPVTWETSDDGVLTVDANGRATALAPGKVTLIARSGPAHTVVEVRVAQSSPISLEVPAPRRSVTTGEQFTLTAVVRDRHGQPVSEPVSWATSDPAIATVSEGGVLLARAPGDVKVTASAAGLESVVELSVATPAPTVAAPARSAPRWRLPALGGVVAAAALAVLLLRHGSDSPSVVPTPPTADSGLAAAADSSTGPAAEPVTPSNAGASRRAAEPVTPANAGTSPPAAEPSVVASVTFDAPASMVEGDTLALQGIVRDTKRTVMPGQRLRWSSSAPTIAAVGATTGRLVARAPGDATITVAVGDVTHRETVHVNAKPETPPPAPAAEPAPVNTAAMAEAAVRAAGVDCIAALQRGNADRVAELYQSATDADRKNADNLLKLMRRGEADLVVSVVAVTLQPRVSGDRAYADFPANLAWKTSFGGKKALDVTFRVSAKNTGGSWQAAGCRMLGTPAF